MMLSRARYWLSPGRLIRRQSDQPPLRYRGRQRVGDQDGLGIVNCFKKVSACDLFILPVFLVSILSNIFPMCANISSLDIIPSLSMSHDFINSSILTFLVVSAANTAGATSSDTATIELASIFVSFISLPFQVVTEPLSDTYARMQGSAGVALRNQ